MADELAEYSKINRHIGSRIRACRKNRGLTIQALADKVNKSRATVSKYETGEISMDMVTLFNLASALQVTPNHLIDYRVPTQSEPRSPNSGLKTFHNAERLYFY